MDQFLASLPKSVVAFGAIVIGFIVIILLNPPKTTCDAQMEIFRESQKQFLYVTSPEDDAVKAPSQVKELFDRCKSSATPGACLDYIEGLKKFIADLNNIPNDCVEQAGEEKEIYNGLWNGMKLMSQIAWGEKPPDAYVSKLSWFDSSELVVFCGLRKNALRFYGNEKFREWRTALAADLPGAAKLLPEEVWQKSLISINCDSYR